MHACACSIAQLCPTLCDPMDRSHQAPLSLGFSRQEYRSGLPIDPPREVSAPEITYIRDGPSSFVVPILVLDSRLIHISPHRTLSLDHPTTNSTGTNLCSLCPLPSKANNCSFRMPLRNQLSILSRGERIAGASLAFFPHPRIFTLEFLLDLFCSL